MLLTEATGEEIFTGDCVGLDGFELPGKGKHSKIINLKSFLSSKKNVAIFLPSPVIFLIVYDPRCESVANLSTIASNSAKI